MTLPPTIDEAVRLIRQQRRRWSSVGELADAVIDRGWDVDRSELIARIRKLFPGPIPRSDASATQRSEAPRKPKPAPRHRSPKPGKTGSAGSKKKRSKGKHSQDYCPRCHAFVMMTTLDGVTTVAIHATKKGGRCTMSGKTFQRRKVRRIDALDRRLPGSYGTGKRR